jgi:CBS domain-containing protein
MCDHKIGGLPVVAVEHLQGEERLVGIITETDLLQHLIELLKDGEDSS